MYLSKYISVIIILFLFFHEPLHAQAHYNAWFRGTVSATLHPKIRIEAEVQHRRQNGFENDNMLHKPLMHSFRTWIHYQHNDALRFSVSPFACFSNNGIIQQKEDEWLLPNHEIRFAAAIELQKPLMHKLHYIIRPGIEYRWFRERNDKISRARNKFGLNYQIGKKLSALVYDELLLNVSGVSSGHFFDHNRVGILMAYQLSQRIKAELGYIYIHRLPLQHDVYLAENNAILNITYHLHK